MANTLWPIALSLVGLLCVTDTLGAAVQTGRIERAFRDPRAGDCTLVVDLETDDVPASLAISLNNRALRIRIGQYRPVVIVLEEPLRYSDQLVGTVGAHEFQAVVGRSEGRGKQVTSCGTSSVKVSWDEREPFEAAGFVGAAFDNFGPEALTNGIPTGRPRSRVTAGFDTQYRFFGKKDGTPQFWVAATVLEGVRTADFDCDKNPQIAVCGDGAPVQERFIYILEHATSREAHFAPRLEFWTRNRDSETPLRFFVGGQIGFIALDGGPQILQVAHVGGGVILPSGPFRASQVFWGLGRSQLFKTDPGFHRFKMRALVAFDLVPTLREKASVFKYLGFGAWRGFIALSVDQSTGDGPDSAQSYLGFAFDFRKAFRP
jgi:hypothetical protein